MALAPSVIHGGFAAVTLGVSAFVAFGPYRHRLPTVLTRFAKYSMAFKLAVLAAVTGAMLYHNLRDQGPASLRWVLGVLSVGFAASAVRVVFLKAGRAST